MSLHAAMGDAAFEEVFVNPAVPHHRKGTPFILHYKIFSQESGLLRTVPDYLVSLIYFQLLDIPCL